MLFWVVLLISDKPKASPGCRVAGTHTPSAPTVFVGLTNTSAVCPSRGSGLHQDIHHKVQPVLAQLGTAQHASQHSVQVVVRAVHVGKQFLYCTGALTLQCFKYLIERLMKASSVLSRTVPAPDATRRASGSLYRWDHLELRGQVSGVRGRVHPLPRAAAQDLRGY